MQMGKSMPVMPQITQLVNNCKFNYIWGWRAVIDRAHITQVPQPASCPHPPIYLTHTLYCFIAAHPHCPIHWKSKLAS